MRLRRVAALSITMALVGCGSDDSVSAMFVESASGMPVVEARAIVLLTTCAHECEANLRETDEVVRIDDVGGDVPG